MRKLIFVLAVLMLVSVSFVNAFAANVTVIDEIGSFSGAVLRVKSPVTQEVGDKILPSEYLANVGIVKFEIETALSEVFLNIVITKDGSIVANIDAGPFGVNGSEILIDRREQVVVEEVVVEEVVVENVTEVVENESVVENVTEVVVENDSDLEEVENVLVALTGRVVEAKENLGYWWYSVSGALVFLVTALVVFMMMKRERRKEDALLSEDDKELKYMEKRVKDTEEKIGKIKESREKKGKLSKIREKLAREEAELRGLEGSGKEEKFEDIKKTKY